MFSKKELILINATKIYNRSFYGSKNLKMAQKVIEETIKSLNEFEIMNLHDEIKIIYDDWS